MPMLNGRALPAPFWACRVSGFIDVSEAPVLLVI